LKLFKRKGRGRNDAKLIYDRCMQQETDIRITAREVSAAHAYPFSLYCAYHVSEENKDPPDPFLEALKVKGMEHEEEIVTTEYPDMQKTEFRTPEEAFMGAIESMSEGIEAISGGILYYMPLGMHGITDLLERRDGKSAFGNHHYIVREIKKASNIKNGHHIQAAFYAMMLGKIQQRAPEEFLITGGDGVTHKFAFGDFEERLRAATEQAVRIRDGWTPPAVYGAGQHPWKGYGNKVAVSNNDVSLIPGVGAGMRTKFTDTGLCTVSDVASSSAAALRQLRGVGDKKSAAYLASAQAIRDGKCIRKAGPVDLPERSTEIFLDLEGLNQIFAEDMTDYLIGALVRKDGMMKYHPFVAEDRQEDVMLEQFLKFMRKQDDYVIYHWHNYEQTHLRKMMERYKVDAYHILEPDTMVDLLKISKEAFAFPTYSNSIKDIAAWLGFKWRHENVGATSSIEIYLKYADDPGRYADRMKMVLDYNEDDCIATQVIKDWMVSWQKDGIHAKSTTSVK